MATVIDVKEYIEDRYTVEEALEKLDLSYENLWQILNELDMWSVFEEELEE